MSLIKTAIHDAIHDQDQPQPSPFTDQQWAHLLTTIQNAIHDHPTYTRTSLQHLHSWLCRIRAESHSDPGA